MFSKSIIFCVDNWYWVLSILGAIMMAWSGYLLESAGPDLILLNKIKLDCKDLYQELNNKQYGTGKYILFVGVLFEVIAIVFSKLDEIAKSQLLTENIAKQKILHEKITTLSEEKIILEDSMAKASKDYYELLNFKIASVANKKLNLTETERISIYRHNSSNKTFEMVSRYSPSPIYNSKGRIIYKDNQGFIGLGWKNGKFTKSGFPKFEGQKDLYVQNIRNECNISREVILNLKMKSSCFYINTIKDTNNHHSVAIVVIESMKPTGLDFGKIDSVYQEISQEIQIDLEALKRLEPRLTIAKSNGL